MSECSCLIEMNSILTLTLWELCIVSALLLLYVNVVVVVGRCGDGGHLQNSMRLSINKYIR